MSQLGPVGGFLHNRFADLVRPLQVDCAYGRPVLVQHSSLYSLKLQKGSNIFFSQKPLISEESI
jgi:hypothetical protein